MTSISQWKERRRLALTQDPFLDSPCSHPLRVCCYGSSSELTPIEYMEEAYSLGYCLGKRGHTCVNGAGMAGCMSAMNDGAADGDGNIVGVIHEMFVVDGSDWRGGSHSVFQNTGKGSVQLLIAGGNDLQQRKNMLIEKADAIVVCPGGPGTFDELWEMTCARNINLMDIPIVCINVAQFYDPFRVIIDRAFKDQLIKKQPQDLIHFVESGSEAVRYIEEFYLSKRIGGSSKEQPKPKLRRKESLLQRPGSIISITPFWTSLIHSFSETPHNQESPRFDRRLLLTLLSGVAMGIALGATMGSRRQK